MVCPVVKRPSAIAFHATDPAVTSTTSAASASTRCAGARPQSLHEEGDAGVLVAGKRARRAEEAQRHHETARDVVGPFDGRGQHIAIEDRERHDDEVGRQ